MKALLVLWVLVVGSIGLMVQGDFGGGAIGLLILAMILLVAWAPFQDMERSDRRAARVVATATVLLGWFLAGILLWDWTGGSFAVAGVVALIALGKAASVPEPPQEPAAEATE